MRDVPTKGANNTALTEQAPSGVVPAIKRVMIRAGLNVRARVGEAAQTLADACAARREQTVEHYDRGQASDSFTDLPAHKAIVKHREIGHLFAIPDPFYRCHDARAGSETLIDGRRYINFASYDYLGLNQHPAVAQAANAAIERFGTSVSASRIVAGERPLHRALETALAEFYGVEAAVTFVSGHATNVSTIGTLDDPGRSRALRRVVPQQRAGRHQAVARHGHGLPPQQPRRAGEAAG